MSVYKLPSSPYYYYDFQRSGYQFRKSTRRKNKKEAEEVERQVIAKVEADLAKKARSGIGPLLWIEVANRYWEEKGRFDRNHKGTFHALALLTEFFGKTKRLDEITSDDVSRLIVWRREHSVLGRGRKAISNSTINRSVIDPFRTVRNYAQTNWGCELPREPNWRKLRLKESGERVRELTADEEAALLRTVRSDYEPWLRFMLMSGRRLGETIIRWSDISELAGAITTDGKGGRHIVTPLFPALRSLLEPLKGHHPDFVFTYVCQKPNVAKRGQKGQRKGERYPITYHGIRSEWRAHMKRAGIVGFRIHDGRHDVGTKANRLGNLKAASRALNHSNTGTTSKFYAHAHDAEVADLLQRVAEGRAGVPQNLPQAEIAMPSNTLTKKEK